VVQWHSASVLGVDCQACRWSMLHPAGARERSVVGLDGSEVLSATKMVMTMSELQ
jgi:hypothetical protein